MACTSSIDTELLQRTLHRVERWHSSYLIACLYVTEKYILVQRIQVTSPKSHSWLIVKTDCLTPESTHRVLVILRLPLFLLLSSLLWQHLCPEALSPLNALPGLPLPLAPRWVWITGGTERLKRWKTEREGSLILPPCLTTVQARSSVS